MEAQIWEDRNVKFDIPNLHNQLRGGEIVFCHLDYVEDTKGNPGDSGQMLVSNLRVIWYSLVHKKFNISIGYSRIINISKKTVMSSLRGTSDALYILAAGAHMRFEFLFTDMSLRGKDKPSVFSPVFDIYRLYQQSVLYRDLKLRGAIVYSKNLIVLPQEQVYNTIHGVWNLSSDQGNLGTFIVTNIRLVWFAEINETFNISLPYLQISEIKIRESKYGPALVVQTLETGGAYVLGFRVDPSEKLNDVYKELRSLYTVYSETPNFGVFYKPCPVLNCDNGKAQINVEDFEEIDKKQECEIGKKFNSYLAEGSNTTEPRQPFYCKELGFAMEKIRDSCYSVSDLWEVIPSSLALSQD